MRWLVTFVVAWTVAAPARADLVGPARAIAGDTLVVAETLVRLEGIDAPEFDQTCTRGTETWSCGDQATQTLADAIADSEVACRDETAVGGDTVTARCSAGGRDLAIVVLESGFAVARGGDDPNYSEAEASARAAALGIWSGEFMDPERWRKVMSCSCSTRKKAFQPKAKSSDAAAP